MPRKSQTILNSRYVPPRSNDIDAKAEKPPKNFRGEEKHICIDTPEFIINLASSEK